MALLHPVVVVIKDIGTSTSMIGLECSAKLCGVLLVHFFHCHPWQQKIGARSHELIWPSVLHLMHHGSEVGGTDWRRVLVNDGAKWQSVVCGQVEVASWVNRTGALSERAGFQPAIRHLLLLVV